MNIQSTNSTPTLLPIFCLLNPSRGSEMRGGVFWGGYPAFTKTWGFQLYQNAPNPLDILVLSNIGIKSVSALSQQSSIIKDQEFDSIHWYKYN